MATTKQKKAFDKMVENGGNVSPAMIEAGYSENTAHTPQKLTESKGWKELMETYLPDELLGQKHRELFEQKQVSYFVFSKSMSDEEIIAHVKASGIEVITVRESDKGKMAFYSIPDAQAIKSGLDMGYKLKGSYAPEKKDITTLGDKLPSTDLDALAEMMANQLKETKV